MYGERCHHGAVQYNLCNGALNKKDHCRSEVMFNKRRILITQSVTTLVFFLGWIFLLTTM